MRALKADVPNIASRHLDLGGCVLYLPLWQPDMVARGGSIASGTGAMAVTPLTLVVGANTITATGAGTFLISVPQAGTCASGTATITGSPVTLNAGTTTTVTTGVTTGTFTVTTGNIIKSKDSIGHLCTISEATWGSQGRILDGTDDYIRVSYNSVFDFGASNFSLATWMYPHTLPGTNAIIIASLDSTPLNPAYFFLSLQATALRWNTYDGVSAGDDLNWTVGDLLNKWSHVAIKRTGATSVEAFLNGTSLGSQADVGINVTNSLPLLVGRIRNNNVWQYQFDGVIGETIIYNRLPTSAEIKNLYQATKWRYN